MILIDRGEGGIPQSQPNTISGKTSVELENHQLHRTPRSPLAKNRAVSYPRLVSPSEQAPAPRGSPQEPHAAVGAAVPALLFADMAKTLSCGLSFWLWHLGHFALSRPKISVSNSCWHSWQIHSKIGMAIAPAQLTPPIRINLWELRKLNR